MTFTTEILIFTNLLGDYLRLLGIEEFLAFGKRIKHYDSKYTAI